VARYANDSLLKDLMPIWIASDQALTEDEKKPQRNPKKNRQTTINLFRRHSHGEAATAPSPAKHGLQPIEAVGTPFDPHLAPGYPAGRICGRTRYGA